LITDTVKIFTAKVMGAAIFITAINYETLKRHDGYCRNPPMNNIPSTLNILSITEFHGRNLMFHSLLDNTNYTILVRRVGTHCVGIDFFTLQINNIITPNKDGINDVLDLKALEI
jgi:hypothetical protein